MPEPRNLGPRPISDLFANCDPLTQARAQVPPKSRREDSDATAAGKAGHPTNPGPAENSPAPSAPGSEPKPNSPEDVGFTKRRELPKEILGFCRSCHAPLYWCDLNGRKHPVDRQVTPDGTLQLFLRDDDTARAIYVPASQREGKALRRSHFASCKQAGQWRKKP